MKFSALAFSLLVSAFSAAAANAQPATQLFHRVSVNGQTSSYTGVVTIDQEAKTIQVVIANDICGQFEPPQPGIMRCQAMAVPVVDFEVPLLSIQEDCGTKIFAGSADRRPVDGALEQVEVVDNSARSCENVITDLIAAQVKVESLRARSATVYSLRK